jgi:alpha(1,3/1,4) fucosyltransferase
MRKKIKIDFSDFWGGFDKTDNYFYNLLKEEFDVEISSNPDYLFFSLFGNQHQNYKCVKIFYTGENIAPPLGYCQYSFSFDYLNDNRNYRLPHYLLYDGYYELVRPKVIEESMSNRKFCNFVASNGDCQERNQFVQQLSKYKKVDCGGRWMNNIGGPVSDKRKFQSEYKFSIAFENNAYRPQHPGYTTEKIMEPMTVNSIPIYWGNPNINLEFNTKSFINFYDFNSEKDMIDYIIDLDNDNDKYLEILKQPWFIDYNIPETNKIENIKSFLYKIFN